jgi:hypothetical protein
LKHYCYLLNPMKSPWNHQYSFLNHYCSLSNPVKISLFSLKKKDLPQPRTQQHSLESPDPGLVVQSKLTFSSAFREGEAKAALRPDLESRGGNPGGKWHIPWAIIKQQHHINILYIYILYHYETTIDITTIRFRQNTTQIAMILLWGPHIEPCISRYRPHFAPSSWGF